ncbi:MAG: hypothetical protein ACOYYJ_18700, partial [Chloroflexota bacterium]
MTNCILTGFPQKQVLQAPFIWLTVTNSNDPDDRKSFYPKPKIKAACFFGDSRKYLPHRQSWKTVWLQHNILRQTDFLIVFL